jgi:predicted metal-binding membrane protein
MAGGMPMPGGWTMSMAWMRMPGQSWPSAAAMFMAMWIAMMVVMMLPSLAPSLVRIRRASGASAAMLLAFGYFAAWTAFGGVAYALGLLAAAGAMASAGVSRVVPLATATVVAVGGALQFTPWKTRQLTHCRDGRLCDPAAPRSAAAGFRLGTHCTRCCSGLMAVLLVIGVMDPAPMIAVTAAITAERLLPRPLLVARAVGAALIGASLLLAVRAFATA